MKKERRALPTQDNIENAIFYKRIWLCASIIWNIVDYAINILAFAASIATVFAEIFISDNAIWIVFFSTIAATLTFVSFAVNPKQHVRKYRKAWEPLNASLLRYYDSDDKTKARQSVVEAIIQGERIISSTYDVD